MPNSLGELQRFPSNVFSDNPIDVSEDQFDRGPFAHEVAELLTRISRGGESSVVALVGSWGSGKTSLLNIIKADLSARDEPHWQIGLFSPWYFDDVSALLEKFFAQLSALLPGENNRKRRKKLARLFRAAAPFGGLGSMVGVSVEKQLEAVATSLEGDASIEAARDDLIEELRTVPDKVLVVIDDLDRLQPPELLQVLKLIRLIGRLPNVFYLLAFDERSILDALKSTAIANGDDARAARYLEKMVQVRIDIPILNDRQRRETFYRLLQVLLSENRVSLSADDETRLWNCYFDYLQYGLHVPRSINRFFAQAQVFFPVVVRETNPVDYLLLVYLRTFYGTLYSQLPRWKSELISGSRNESHEQLWRGRLHSRGVPLDEESDVLAVLTSVFPRMSPSESVRRSYSEGQLRKTQRAASAEYFDRYFQQAVPSHQIPDRVIVECLAHFTGGELGHTGDCKMLNWIRDDPVEAFRKLEHAVGLREPTDIGPLVDLFLNEYDSHNTSATNEWCSRVQRSIEETLREVLTIRGFDLSDPPRGTHRLLRDDSTGKLAAEVVRGLQVRAETPAWLPNFRRAVKVRLRETISSWSEFSVESVRSRREFFLWSFFVSDDEVRSLVQSRITSGQWDFLAFLSVLGDYRLYYSSDETGALLYAHFNTMKPSDIESTLGGRFAIDVAGELLDADLGDPSLFVDEPYTPDRCREYVLCCIAVMSSFAAYARS